MLDRICAFECLFHVAEQGGLVLIAERSCAELTESPNLLKIVARKDCLVLDFFLGCHVFDDLGTCVVSNGIEAVKIATLPDKDVAVESEEGKKFVLVLRVVGRIKQPLKQVRSIYVFIQSEGQKNAVEAEDLEDLDH